mmetsp:Transcript_115950/g.223583  ORF Transcript_115950/g.223583 Transcript_115950/m.223583 type:complete len:89 (+) Transcript_115950:1058-1324(+)
MDGLQSIEEVSTEEVGESTCEGEEKRSSRKGEATSEPHTGMAASSPLRNELLATVDKSAMVRGEMSWVLRGHCQVGDFFTVAERDEPL